MTSIKDFIHPENITELEITEEEEEKNADRSKMVRNGV